MKGTQKLVCKNIGLIYHTYLSYDHLKFALDEVSRFYICTSANFNNFEIWKNDSAKYQWRVMARKMKRMEKKFSMAKWNERNRAITRLFSVYLGEITDLGSSPRLSMAIANAYKTTFLHESEQCRGTWTDKISRIYGKSYLTTGTLHIRRGIYLAVPLRVLIQRVSRAPRSSKTSLFRIILMIDFFV